MSAALSSWSMPLAKNSNSANRQAQQNRVFRTNPARAIGSQRLRRCSPWPPRLSVSSVLVSPLRAVSIRRRKPISRRLRTPNPLPVLSPLPLPVSDLTRWAEVPKLLIDNTCRNYARNSRRISTYDLRGLKPFRISTCRKMWRNACGGGLPFRRRDLYFRTPRWIMRLTAMECALTKFEWIKSLRMNTCIKKGVGVVAAFCVRKVIPPPLANKKV